MVELITKTLQLNVGEELDKKMVSWEPDFRQFHTQLYFGIHYRFYFDNGYGASVIKAYGSNGYEKDLWELLVLKYDEDRNAWQPCYDTMLTDDVIGYMTDEDVRTTLDIISKIREGKHRAK